MVSISKFLNNQQMRSWLHLRFDKPKFYCTLQSSFPRLLVRLPYFSPRNARISRHILYSSRLSTVHPSLPGKAASHRLIPHACIASAVQEESNVEVDIIIEGQPLNGDGCVSSVVLYGRSLVTEVNTVSLRVPLPSMTICTVQGSCICDLTATAKGWSTSREGGSAF